MDTIALASQALKLFYLDGLRTQINEAMPFLAEIEKRPTNSVSGEKIVMALKYGRTGGVGNRADNETMPMSNPRKRRKAEWDTKNIYAHIEITDKTIRASRDSAGAFADLLQADLEDALTDAKDSMSRQVFGDGTGVIATITTGTTGTTFTCAGGVFALWEGQFVDIYDSTLSTAKATGREVTVVDVDNNTFTISGANVTVVNGDKVVISGSLNKELTGLEAVVAQDNTLYGINRATEKWFNAHVRALNGNISEVAIQARIDYVDKRAGGVTNFIVTSDGVRRSYQSLLMAMRQIVDTVDLKGGYSAIAYVSGNKKIPITTDKYCPAGVMYGLDLNDWALYQMSDWEWLEDGGGKILHLMSQKAVWEATLVKYCDLGCSKPAGQWKMTGITEQSA